MLLKCNNKSNDPEIHYQCTIELTEKNVVGDKEVSLIGFYQNESFYFQGYCLLGAFTGTFSVNQFFMTSSEYHLDMYICLCPSTHSLCNIQATGFPATNVEVNTTPSLNSSSASSKIYRIPFSPSCSSLSQKIVDYAKELKALNTEKPFDSILVLLDFSWSQLHVMQQITPKLSIFEPSKKWNSKDGLNNHGVLSHWNIPMVYPVLQFPANLNPILSPPSWQAAFQTVFLDFSACKNEAEKGAKPPSCFPSVMAVGSKGSGKSTMNKMLVNLLLSSFSKVAFLDLDPGATEMTEPGVISLSLIDFPLLGPGYMYSHRPILAQYLGSTSPLVHPEMYLSLVRKVFKEYQLLANQLWQTHQLVLPLVVNTMGWVRSLGYELLQQVVQEIQPTHSIILQAKENGWLHSEDHALFSMSTKTMFAEVIKLEQKSKFNQSDLHAIALTYKLMNHSTQALPNLDHKEPWLQPIPLTSPYYPTYTLPLHELRIITPHVDIPYEHVLHSINATVVGLVLLPPKDINLEEDMDEIQQTYGGPEYLTSLPRHHHYVGLGVVRGISGPSKGSTTRYLYLCTPLDPSLLQHVKTLVRGDLDLVNWIYTWGLPTMTSDMPSGPYMTLLSGEGPGSMAMYARKRISRLYSARKEVN